MDFCIKCGTKLIEKYLEHEGNVPFCQNCNEYRFKQFNVAVSMVVLNKEMNKTLFIEQYIGRSRHEQPSECSPSRTKRTGL